MSSMQYFDMTERDSINHLIKYTVIHSLINIVWHYLTDVITLNEVLVSLIQWGFLALSTLCN